ncbi:MAG: helix-turn-helix transcriptional regulator [Anaerolineales bacterium]|nr:helix-turn-helix transcriptional regulator [Anaerolineales bacterium]
MKEYRQQARILRALAHPMRLQILDSLARGPACVCELITVTGRRQAYISQHLMVLRQTGMVKSTRLGLNMRYELATESTKDMLQCILQDCEAIHPDRGDAKVHE